jgi:hypothetical protein
MKMIFILLVFISCAHQPDEDHDEKILEQLIEEQSLQLKNELSKFAITLKELQESVCEDYFDFKKTAPKEYKYVNQDCEDEQNRKNQTKKNVK